MHLEWATSMLRARCQHVLYAQQVRRALHTSPPRGGKATSPLHATACGRIGSQSRGTPFGSSSHQRSKVGNVSVRTLHRGAIAQTPTLSAAQPIERIYSQTVKLPNTRFELLREGTNREDLYRPRTSEELYRWQTGQKERPTFVLQDGPPYANGRLHLGHTVNKVLKDIINRYNVLKGKRVEYVPGWDCHGLPIEQKVVSRFPGVSPDKIDPLTMRQECRKYASDAVEEQRNDFQRLSIMADWSQDTTYRTYEPEYEMQQLKVFGQMVQNGLIYRAYKPVPWSPSSRTALAEAEIEYMDKNDRSLYVCFPLTLGPKLLEYAKTVPDGQEVARKAEEGAFKVDAVIWTTTAWSLPSNMAMNINPDLSYSIVRATEGSRKGQQFVVATDAVAQFEKVRLGLSGQGSKLRPQVGPVETLFQFPGSCLLDSTYRHPFLPSQSAERPILPASYVTTTDGTGLVHSAPAHGKDDFRVWSDHCRTSSDAAKEDIINLVDERGSFSSEFDALALNLGVDYGEIAGKSALGQGSREIVHLLEKQRWLLGERTYLHSYPHDWRSKLPLITRATSQWFANVDKIKEDAIRALEKVRFVPETGRARLEAFVRGRSEWCISRQRSWGVPIPVLYNSEDNTPLITASNINYIISVLTAKGTDYWWEGEAEEFLEPKEREKGIKYYKGLDTMDVWFDSGTAWSQSTSAQEHVREKPDSLIESPPKPYADVYIEGSDQHRGWFQSSLLTYLATAASPNKSVAPFRMVITHGFLVDKRKKKMSKSEGNVISPEFFLLGGPKQKDPSFGADAVRWWVARVDYTHEIVVSSLVIKHASDELRKIRNTFRFLLSYAPKPGERPAMDPEHFGFIEQYMLLQLAAFSKDCQQAYEACNFALVTRRAAELCTSYISAFYLIVTKDALYCSSEEDKYRQSVVVLIDELLRTLLSVIAPIAPHLAEEVWHFYLGATGPPSIDAGSTPSTSYFHNVWHKGHTLCDAEQGKEILGDMKVAFALRDSVLATLEEKRQEKAVRSGQEVRLSLLLPKDRERDVAALHRRIDDLAQIFGLSEVAVVETLPDQGDNGEIWPVVDICRKTQVKFALQPSRHHECPRCRMFKRSKEESTCDRCASVLRGIGFKS